MSGKRRGRGEGSIEQLPSGKWRAVISLGKGADGKRQKLQETFATKREALNWRQEQHGLIRQGVAVGAGKRSVADWLQCWLEIIRPTKAPGTWQFYNYHVKNMLTPQIGHMRL